jgi:hypothetical protein
VIRFGRLPDNEVAFDPHAIRRLGRHARSARGRRWVIVDVRSRNARSARATHHAARAHDRRREWTSPRRSAHAHRAGSSPRVGARPRRRRRSRRQLWATPPMETAPRRRSRGVLDQPRPTSIRSPIRRCCQRPRVRSPVGRRPGYPHPAAHPDLVRSADVAARRAQFSPPMTRDPAAGRHARRQALDRRRSG